MGWAHIVLPDGREVGYAVEATCDKDGCKARIDRGLAYVCGGMHEGDEHGCGNYFCPGHLLMGVALPVQLCEACAEEYEREYPEEVEAAITAFRARVEAARAEAA